MTAHRELTDAWNHWNTATLTRRWRRDNPREAAQLDTYRNGGPRPTLATPTGQALVAETAAWHLTRPAPGQLLFDGRWETNTIPSPYTPTATGWTIVPASAQGTDQAGRYAELTLPPAPASETRALEAVKERTPRLGTTDYYHLRIYLPTGWQSPGPWGAMIAQLGYPALRHHGWGLVAEADRIRLALNTGHITWATEPGRDTAATFEYSLQNGPAIPPDRLTLGEWHHLILEITWATTPTGTTRIWHRRTTDTDWTQTINLTGIPTQQWGKGWDQLTNPLREMTVDGLYAANGQPFLCWDKLGFYAAGAPYPRTIRNGGLVRGTTFDIVAAAATP